MISSGWDAAKKTMGQITNVVERKLAVEGQVDSTGREEALKQNTLRKANLGNAESCVDYCPSSWAALASGRRHRSISKVQLMESVGSI